MSEESTTPAGIDEALSRRISDALNAEDGIAGDPELGALLASSPEAMLHAKHLGRVGRWLAMWPLETPSDTDFEALASKIEARLGESFDEDFTQAPFFESETPSRPPGEDGKAAIARIPLRKSPRSSITELPVLKRDPRSSDEEISLDTLAIAAATQPEPVAKPALVLEKVEASGPESNAIPVVEAPKLGAVEVAKSEKTPSIRPVSVPPPAATKSERPKPAVVPKPRPDPDATQKVAPVPVAAVTPIRAASPKASRERSWWPGVLAAAAVGIGAIGVASLSLNQQAPTQMAAVAAELPPLTAPAPAVPSPTPSSPTLAVPMAEAPAPVASAVAQAAPTPVAQAAPTPVAVSVPTEQAFVGQGGGGEGSSPAVATTPATGMQAGGARHDTPNEPPPQRDEGAPAARGAALAPAPPPSQVAGRPAERPRSAARRATAPVAELSRDLVASVMQGLTPQVLACANGRHGTVPVDVVVQPSGQVTGATVTGTFQGTPEGSCIARAVRGARFPGYVGEEATRFRYPYAF